MAFGEFMKFTTPDQMKTEAEMRVLSTQNENAKLKGGNQAALARTFGVHNGAGYYNAGLMNQWASSILPDQDYGAKLRQMGLSPDQIQQRFQVPKVTSGPIWSDQQIQDQVNNLKASSAQQADTNTRKYQERMAQQGYGQGSPITFGAQIAIDNARMAGDSAAERQARWEAAQGNANFQQQGEIASGKLQNDYLNALISSQAAMLNMFQQNQAARSQLLSNALGQIFS